MWGICIDINSNFKGSLTVWLSIRKLYLQSFSYRNTPDHMTVTRSFEHHKVARNKLPNYSKDLFFIGQWNHIIRNWNKPCRILMQERPCPFFKTHGESHPKFKTKGTSGSTKWTTKEKQIKN